LLVSNAREMMDDGRRWMMERWNELILVPAGPDLMVELLCTALMHRFDGGVWDMVNRKIPAKSSNKLQTRDCHCLLAW
jgi:hypothetical protein